ncbi:MAG: hypothetical protein ACMXYF_01935 [Candidatus Woesearchaeota archaeon]
MTQKTQYEHAIEQLKTTQVAYELVGSILIKRDPKQLCEQLEGEENARDDSSRN